MSPIKKAVVDRIKHLDFARNNGRENARDDAYKIAEQIRDDGIDGATTRFYDDVMEYAAFQAMLDQVDEEREFLSELLRTIQEEENTDESKAND